MPLVTRYGPQNNVHYKTLNIVQFDKSLMATAGSCSLAMACAGTKDCRGHGAKEATRASVVSLVLRL
jgi:hypothetical protein